MENNLYNKSNFNERRNLKTKRVYVLNILRVKPSSEAKL